MCLADRLEPPDFVVLPAESWAAVGALFDCALSAYPTVAATVHRAARTTRLNTVRASQDPAETAEGREITSSPEG